MMSVAPLAGGQEHYYAGLSASTSTGTYYAENGEKPGLWFGKGLRAFGIKEGSVVDVSVFRNLFRGLSPDGKRPLVQNARAGHGRTRRPGFDLTFSAPKSFSVLWALARPEQRATLAEAHDKAVRAALRFLEDTLAFTRKRDAEGAVVRTKADLVIARFGHLTSRAGDMQVHEHCLVLNLAVDAAGAIRTVDGRPLFVNKMLLGSIFRLALSKELCDLGLSCTRPLARSLTEKARQASQKVRSERNLEDKVMAGAAALLSRRREPTFEIDGVPAEIISVFSKRSQEIRALLQKQSHTGAVAAAQACLQTRQKKGEAVPLDRLLAAWRDTARQKDFPPEKAQALFTDKDLQVSEKKAFRKAFRTAVKVLVNHPKKSSFSASDLLRETCIAAQGKGISFEAIQRRLPQAIERSKLCAVGQDRDGQARFAGAKLVAKEQDVLAFVKTTRDAKRHVVAADRVQHVLKYWRLLSGKKFDLNQEQAAALRNITTREGSVHLVLGMAGTGKSTLFEAARLVWEGEGYRVLGLCPSGKATQGLQEGSGIASYTIHKYLEEQKKPFFRLDTVRITKNTVVVLDEAGMVDTELLHRVVTKVQEVGAKLILSGDPRQHQAVEKGQMLGTLETLAKAEQWPVINELKEIVRLREDWRKEAAHELARGDAAAALKRYQENDCVRVAGDRQQAIQELVKAYVADGLSNKRVQEKLILVGLNAEAKRINEQVQRQRRGLARFYDLAFVKLKGQTIHHGDRVLFTQNSTHYGVQNGSLGTVKHIDMARRLITVKLDTGVKVTLSTKKYRDIELGYAVTSHDGQGTTCERAYVLAGGTMTYREQSYVDMTRSRGRTQIFVDRANAGPSLTVLAEQMSRSRANDSAVDHLVSASAKDQTQELAQAADQSRRQARERKRDVEKPTPRQPEPTKEHRLGR